jgi:hypothetical protein
MLTFKRMTKEDGDKPEHFDVSNAEGLAAADARFKELTGRGFLAWVKGPTGESVQVKALDPSVHADADIIVQPMRIGG